MTTTRRRRGWLALYSQTARASKRARFTLVISGILLLLGMGAPRRADAQVESVIHNFVPGDGGFPAGLIMDSSGNLYGTARQGGSTPCGCGTVFELVYDSTSNSYTLQVLYKFTGTDGALPTGSLFRDSSGNLYGSTIQGGSSNAGTVFELVYNSTTNSYTEQVLYNFAGGASDGHAPNGGLVRDSAGNLYGTTPGGGFWGDGTVFELVYDSATNTYTEHVLYVFTGSEGVAPNGGLVRDSSGYLYGTTHYGGLGGSGIVFELVYNSTTNSYTEQTLHNFSGGSDGGVPYAGVITDSSGNLYGTTPGGGFWGDGTVFELVYDSTTNSYTENVLYNFSGGSDGAKPLAGLVRDSSGNLYGTTYEGGSPGPGTVFELVYDSTSNSYTEQVLHSLGWPGDGINPDAALARDSLGNLYGTASGGYGIVFGIAPLTLSATSLDFGIVEKGTTSGLQTVTLTNIGQAGLSYSSASLSGTNAPDFAITTDGCGGTTVPTNSTCSVSVTFTPNTLSAESAALNLTENGLTQTVALTGTGGLPTANLSATGLTFPAQPVGATSSPQTVTVSNTSTFILNLTSVGITGDFAIDSNTCNASVGAGQSCTVGVTFLPTATGTRTGRLSLTDDAADSPQVVALSGEGEDFSIAALTTSATIGAGGTVSYDILLSPESGYSGNVSLTCSGAPSKSTCSVSPASLTLNGTDNSAVTLKVSTTATSGMVPPVLAPWDLPPLVVFWIGLFVLLGVGVGGRFIPARTRIRPALLASLAAMLLAITFWTACGGGGSTASSVTHGTPAGTYTLTVTGASGNLSHSTTVSLTVR